MGREFICRRCGTANRRGVENCSYCGLQVGWKPSYPDLMRFWRWPLRLTEIVGSLAAFAAAALEIASPAGWTISWLTVILLAFSAIILAYHSTLKLPGAESGQ